MNSYSMFACMRHFFCAAVLPMWTMSSPKGVQNNHMAAPVKVARQQTPLELSGTFRNLPAARAGTLRNLPEPASGTYTSTHRNCPEPSGTDPRNLHRNSPEPTPAHTGTLRQFVKHTPELSGTFLRNLLLQPAKAHTGAYLG